MPMYAGIDFLARCESNPKGNSKLLAEAAGGIVLAIRMQPGIEQRPALRVLDQKHWNRDSYVAFGALHQPGEFGGNGAAGEGVNP